jgi:hypothetical protein
MIGAVIDGPPDEIVHWKYIEEARSGETGAWREINPAVDNCAAYPGVLTPG